MTTNGKKNIVIVGGSFAGLTAAYELKRKLGDRHNVTVVDKNGRFTFIPSLIWVPFGWRTPRADFLPASAVAGTKGHRVPSGDR